MMQARFLLRALCIPAFPVLLAACAGPTGEYPSLAIRDGERVSGEMAAGPAEPYIPPAPPPATVEEATSLAAEARALHAQFLSDMPGVRNRVANARGSSVGSEAWSDAQVALTILESHYGRMTVMLADIEALYVATSTEGQAIAPLEAERDAVADMVTQEEATIEGLLAQIPR